MTDIQARRLSDLRARMRAGRAMSLAQVIELRELTELESIERPEDRAARLNENRKRRGLTTTG